MNEKRKKMTEPEVAAGLKDLPDWRVTSGKLHRQFEFKDFVEAWGFMSRAALVIQERDHHPEWSNVYNKVTIDLVTHSEGGITGLDMELAGKLEELAGV